MGALQGPCVRSPAGTGGLLRHQAADLPLLLQRRPRCLRLAVTPLYLRKGQVLGGVESPLMLQHLQDLLLGTQAHLLGQRQSLALLLVPQMLQRGGVPSPLQEHVLALVLLMQALGILLQVAVQLQMGQLQDSDYLPALDWNAPAL